MKKLWHVCLFFFLFSSCTKNLCDVGDTKITSRDIEFRKRVSEVYYPGSGKDYVALAQLVKGYLSEEVLKSLGYKIDESILEGEAERIDKNTKAPDVLERIKRIYGRNRRDYIKTFVRIVYAERFLYNEVFLKSRDIHRREFQKMEDFLHAVKKSPHSFKKIAEKMDLEAKRLRVSKDKGILRFEGKSIDERKETGSGSGQADRIIDLLKGLKEGMVYPDVIEWMEGYQVIRLVKKEGDEYIVDSVSIQKRNYDEWFWERAKEVPVKIYDEKLKDKFIKEVGWARMVNLR